MLTGSASYILTGPLSMPLSVPSGVASRAAFGGSTAGAASCGGETTFAWSESFEEEEEEGACSECSTSHELAVLAAACRSSVRSVSRRASTLASSAGAARFSSTAARSSPTAPTRGGLTGATSLSSFVPSVPVLEDGMGTPSAESRPLPSGSAGGGAATMTCVPCVAEPEPGSEPESRTDSKRESEGEPAGELELEHRCEFILASMTRGVESGSAELRCGNCNWMLVGVNPVSPTHCQKSQPELRPLPPPLAQTCALAT